MQKNEILKDLSAFANHPSDEDKYIIIGVTERDGLAAEFHDIGDLIDEAKYQQFVHSNIEPSINFEYKQFFLTAKNWLTFGYSTTFIGHISSGKVF